MKGILRWPLVIAAIFVIGRVVLEQLGAPETVNNKISVAVLYTVVFPVWFAMRIAGAGVNHPYLTLFRTIAVYTALVRLMIVPMYWLAYLYQWSAPRFSVGNAGVVGPGVTPLYALLFPFLLGAEWVIGALIVGGPLGSIVMAVKRRSVSSKLSP